MKAILKAIKILMIAIKATKNTYDSIENKDNLDYFHREMVGRIISFHRTTTNCQKYQKSAKQPKYQKYHLKAMLRGGDPKKYQHQRWPDIFTLTSRFSNDQLRHFFCWTWISFNKGAKNVKRQDTKDPPSGEFKVWQGVAIYNSGWTSIWPHCSSQQQLLLTTITTNNKCVPFYWALHNSSNWSSDFFLDQPK